MTDTVLIIEDHDSMALALELVVRRAGAEPVILETTVGLEETIAERAPSVVVIDADLAGGSGLDLCQTLSRGDGCDGPGPRLLLLSAACGRIDIERAFALGADAVLPKPFALGDLTATLDTLLHCGTTAEEGAA